MKTLTYVILTAAALPLARLGAQTAPPNTSSDSGGHRRAAYVEAGIAGGALVAFFARAASHDSRSAQSSLAMLTPAHLYITTDPGAVFGVTFYTPPKTTSPSDTGGQPPPSNAGTLGDPPPTGPITTNKTATTPPSDQPPSGPTSGPPSDTTGGAKSTPANSTATQQKPDFTTGPTDAGHTDPQDDGPVFTPPPTYTPVPHPGVLALDQALTTTPEPDGGTLIATGLMGLLPLVRRRRR